MSEVIEAPRELHLTASQLAQFNSVEDSNPTLVGKRVDQLPTDVYVSPERYALEQKKLFRGRPIPVGVSNMLPGPRTRVAVDDYGPSILLTRDEEGQVHAFHNICTHRAIKLCQSHEAVKGGLVTCPYHAWSFDMKGQLKSLPRPEVFPGLDKHAMGLKELQCVEAGGVIWVNLDRDVDADFSVVSGPLAADFDAIGLPQQKICHHLRVEVMANWKLIVDSFSENYHVTRLHANSLGSMFIDRATSCEMIGEHMRVMSGRAGFRQGEEVETFEQFRRSAVVHYTIVPGALIITSPTYISVMLLAPAGIDRTIVNYYLLVDRLPETERETVHYEKSLALMKRVTTEEDFWVAELGTAAAREGVIEHITCGGMEREIVRFHETVNAILAQ
ncbi:aromatic ring-hydroxylating dioxygenase subunit alpha [Novosphingobium sp. BL-8H]|uniref:aromatic ring-hydroxylating oxygenase subunit alpha n=1 Tax=Novosphingobium sp. BL-8H TaxID=3127640 RepID=UPI003758471C